MRANLHELKIFGEIWIENIKMAKEGLVLKWEEKLRLAEVILHQAAVTLRSCPGGAPAMMLG
jgi:hypothetical protein